MSILAVERSKLRPGVHFINACGVRLRVVIDMDRPRPDSYAAKPVVILHGFTGSAESMETVSETLSARHLVVRLELIGHGGSESPTRPENY